MPTTVTKTVGSGGDYADLAAFMTYALARNLVTNDELLIASLLEDQSLGYYLDWNNANTDATRHIIVRPNSGQSFQELNPSGVVGYPTTGRKITLTAGYDFSLICKHGIRFENLRIELLGSGGGIPLRSQAFGSGYPGGIYKCAISGTNGTAPMLRLEAGAKELVDCIVVGTGSTTIAMVESSELNKIERCTIAVSDESRTALAVISQYGQITLSRNNAIRGNVTVNYIDAAGGSEVTSSGANFRTGTFTETGNATRYTAGTFASTTSAAAFESATTDYRPKAAGPLVGAADSSANSTNDINNVSRGSDPDVGALSSAGDTTAPTLTSVSGTDTGSTSATVSASSTEAGPGWAVLTPTSTQPSQAQVEAGQDHTGSTTGVFLDTATLAIGANPAAFAFTGLTPGATYWPHVVAKDTATPTANVSAVESGPSFTMPAPDLTDPAFAGGTTLNAGAKTNSSIALSTSAVATDNIAVTGYEWSSDNGATYPFTSLTNSFTFTALADLTSYNFRVRAYDGAGNRSTPLSLTTSTYRAGDTAANVIANTAAVGANPAGHLYALALTQAPVAWLSYRTISGPTPGDGILFEYVDGRYTYNGPSQAVWTVQPEINMVDHTETTVINLYDVTGGTLKTWNGSAWVVKPLKYWTGSAWVAKPLKRWNGTAWV